LHLVNPIIEAKFIGLHVHKPQVRIPVLNQLDEFDVGVPGPSVEEGLELFLACSVMFVERHCTREKVGVIHVVLDWVRLKTSSYLCMELRRGWLGAGPSSPRIQGGTPGELLLLLLPGNGRDCFGS